MYALDSVDLDIKSGEFLTLLGPSGSGKTTFLMAIAGFNRPDAGSIRFGDEEMILKAPHQRGVGMVFQSYALFPHMTVAENIAFPLKLRGVAAQKAPNASTRHWPPCNCPASAIAISISFPAGNANASRWRGRSCFARASC